MKIHLVRVKLFYVDRRTDMKKLIVAIRNFANAPKKSLCIYIYIFNTGGIIYRLSVLITAQS
jgi:hypothetical protein